MCFPMVLLSLVFFDFVLIVFDVCFDFVCVGCVVQRFCLSRRSRAKAERRRTRRTQEQQEEEATTQPKKQSRRTTATTAATTTTTTQARTTYITNKNTPRLCQPWTWRGRLSKRARCKWVVAPQLHHQVWQSIALSVRGGHDSGAFGTCMICTSTCTCKPIEANPQIGFNTERRAGCIVWVVHLDQISCVLVLICASAPRREHSCSGIFDACLARVWLHVD
jgi:hypothetical protein